MAFLPPGAAAALEPAGGDVGPFWDVWHWHHISPKVGAYLEKLRIGALDGAADDDAPDPPPAAF